MLILFTGCAGMNKTGGPGNTKTGKELYEIRCQNCHKLHNPKKYSDLEWKVFVKKYGRKAKLNKKERLKVLNYLLENN